MKKLNIQKVESEKEITGQKLDEEYTIGSARQMSFIYTLAR